MMTLAPLLSAFPQADFARKIEWEFITGSTIHPTLYQVATQIVSDTEILPGGEPCFPIHEALNWHITRFGHRARETMNAVLLLNEDSSCWQAKLSQPVIDSKKQKPRKYETPVGNGSRVYMPAVPAEIRQRISQRYGIQVPLEGSFWDWVEAHPEIPMVPTEGGKKGLSLLSAGYVPLALYGVNGGYSRQPGDTRVLVPDVARFATPGRQFIFAFDQDSKDSAKRRVAVALYRFGGLLLQSGCLVKVASWDHQQGKGVDDLTANCGVTEWNTAYSEAIALEHWQIWQRLERRLTYPASIRLTTADLSDLQLNNLPKCGIIAIASPKGTGKTKYIHSLVETGEKVLASGHRIALMRNLCSRLELDYKGDLDKVNGAFITGAGYTLRIGLCVDSLLSIDPNKFAGCDLILDEVVQVLRHLLTSSTCARDGKRPALLARFRELVQAARRVIVADADLDNATMSYLKSLRGSDDSVFLLQNAYQAEGYPVRFLQASDRTTIVGEIMAAVKALAPGKAVFIATDSKGTSKAIARLLDQHHLKKRLLLVNSETSGGECEREFIQTPDTVLERHEYDVIICSPSVATGVSIETKDVIAAVYGIFTGVSSTDADMTQALGRVREPVERVVWCDQKGTNFSKVSRSTNQLEIKSHLQQKTTATVRLIRSGLREDLAGDLTQYDWQNDPHLNLYCQISADQNFAMYHLRNALLVRLQFEGNQVSVEDRTSDPAVKLLLATAKQEIREIDAETLVAIEDLTYTEVAALEQKEGLSSEESLAISRYYFKEFYALDSITVENVLWDNEGRRRAELLSLEAQLFPGLAIDRVARSLERQATWNQSYCPWDISNAELRRTIRSVIGIDELLAKLQAGWTWTQYDLEPYAAKARAFAKQIKVALHLTISDKMSDTQVVHQLLAQLGVKVEQACWSRSVAGHEGEKLRVYQLHQDHWICVWAVLQRRQAKRQQIQQQSLMKETLTGSPVVFEFKDGTGDPASKDDWSFQESPTEEEFNTALQDYGNGGDYVESPVLASSKPTFEPGEATISLSVDEPVI
ncbi:plasmid replication protein, CyRepA1 family [Leptolyngbyaceae cyanobacterium UHCC 1019]